MDFIEKLRSKFKKTPQAPKSPGSLAQKNLINPEVRRITKAPLVICAAFGLLIAGGVGYTAYIQNTPQVNASAPKAAKPIKQTDNKPDWFASHQQTKGLITADSNNSTASTTDLATAKQLASSDSGELVTASQNNAEQTAPVQQMSPCQQARLQEWQQHENDKQQLIQSRRASLQNALGAETTIYSNSASNGGLGNRNTLTGAVKQDDSESAEPSHEVFSAKPDIANYLGNTRVPAISPFEVKAGTVIPSTMIGGVNSDLAGQIIAQVSQNVFDTASGAHLLIPQGTRLVGTYDHEVQNGQKRVFVVWHRLIYPDASSVNIGDMPGADQAGYAGFKDKVNNHLIPTFRNALLLSAITAGVQLSQPRPGNGDNGYSSQQILASSLGLQMNQLGMNTISRGLSQPPTISIRPGYIFHVMVTKDMILPPWGRS